MPPQPQQDEVIPAPVPEPIPEPSPREILYKTAMDCLGTDASPADKAPDDLACAESVNVIHKKAFGILISEPGLSTIDLYKAMIQLKTMFLQVPDPMPGDIIISPTGYGNGKVPHGHVGIIAPGGVVMSNDSDTGLWKTKYNIQSWRQRYQMLGGFPVLFFRRV